MTEDQFLEQWGDVEVAFSHYYKYSFTYIGFGHNEEKVIVNVGGSAEDIYRLDVSNNESNIVRNLACYSGTVYNKDGDEIGEFYDLY